MAMRLPRVRFTVRRMMILVAVLGVVLAGLLTLNRRRARFEAMRDLHFSRSMYTMAKPDREIRFYDQLGRVTHRFDLPEPTPEQVRLRAAEHQWHVILAQKYGRAARHPWLPVEPDPPEPR